MCIKKLKKSVWNLRQKTIIFIYLYTSSMYRAEALQQLGKQKKMYISSAIWTNDYEWVHAARNYLQKSKKIGTLIANYYFSSVLFSKGKRTILKSQIYWKKFKGAVSREKFLI